MSDDEPIPPLLQSQKPVNDEKFDDPEKSSLPNGQSKTELWEEIGFHKPVAGFWYNLNLFLIELVLGIFISGGL
jgi:hypothetical protein